MEEKKTEESPESKSEVNNKSEDKEVTITIIDKRKPLNDPSECSVMVKIIRFFNNLLSLVFKHSQIQKFLKEKMDLDV
jgi:hypothetical protein